MRDLVSMARRLLETRRTVKELERTAAGRGELDTLSATRLMVFRGALQALAWALEIDLDQMDSPSLTNLLANEHPAGVRLHRVDVTGPDGATRILWLTEIPAYRDPVDEGFSTEYWSCFLSDAQARELYRALGETLPLPTFPVCTLPSARPHPVVQPAPRPLRSIAPTSVTPRAPRRPAGFVAPVRGFGPDVSDAMDYPGLPQPPQRGA